MGKEKTIEMLDTTWGRLTVKEPAEPGPKGQFRYRCECVCGNFVEVLGSNLRCGNTLSCGCLQRERAAKSRTKHGDVNTVEYRAWASMKERCFNENNGGFENYGIRGIVVCQRWLDDYLNFLEDMGRAPENTSLDRIDVNKGYEPGNCRWSTKLVQANNKTNAVILEYDGRVMNLSEWARERNIKISTLQARLFRFNYSVGKALKFLDDRGSIIQGRKAVDRSLITFKGESLSRNGWARKLGITGQALKTRIKNWGLEKALTIPKAETRNGHGRLDLTGKKFGRLKAVSFAEKVNGLTAWNCECECGNKLVVLTTNLRNGNTSSCGCYRSDQTKKALTKHGMCYSREYKIYKAMIGRCYNENTLSYPNYGGRGITVCQEWLDDFMNFYNDVGPRPKGYSLERMDNDGNYESSNCKWVSAKEQGRNKRNTKEATYNGKTQSIAAWADELGIRYGRLNLRLYRGWTFEEAVLAG